MMSELKVIHEDNHLLVVDKPAGIATMGSESGATLHSIACGYLRKKYNKPGKVYLGVVSRLDSMTSGVIVFARTSKAAARLNQQFANTSTHSASKTYLALVTGEITRNTSATWTDYVYKDDAAHRMRISQVDNPSCKKACLSWVSLYTNSKWSLVAVRLRTGRKHQIRLQFSDRSHPILGDRKYEATSPFGQGIALHSWRLSIEHPTKKEVMMFDSEPPLSWKRYLKELPQGGVPEHGWEGLLPDSKESKQ